MPTPAEIKAKRLELGLTQAQAASLVDVTLRTWQGWESDSTLSSSRNMPSLKWAWFQMATQAPQKAP